MAVSHASAGFCMVPVACPTAQPKMIADGAHILAGGYRKCNQPVHITSAYSSSGVIETSRAAAAGSAGMAASLQDWVQRGTVFGSEMLARAARAGGTAIEAEVSAIN